MIIRLITVIVLWRYSLCSRRFWRVYPEIYLVANSFYCQLFPCDFCCGSKPSSYGLSGFVFGWAQSSSLTLLQFLDEEHIKRHYLAPFSGKCRALDSLVFGYDFELGHVFISIHSLRGIVQLLSGFRKAVSPRVYRNFRTQLSCLRRCLTGTLPTTSAALSRLQRMIKSSLPGSRISEMQMLLTH